MLCNFSDIQNELNRTLPMTWYYMYLHHYFNLTSCQDNFLSNFTRVGFIKGIQSIYCGNNSSSCNHTCKECVQSYYNRKKKLVIIFSKIWTNIQDFALSSFPLPCNNNLSKARTNSSSSLSVNVENLAIVVKVSQEDLWDSITARAFSERSNTINSPWRNTILWMVIDRNSKHNSRISNYKRMN